MGETQGRWLRPKDVAQHIGKPTGQILTLVKKGKLPAPSYHFGPKSPRYDREEIDRLLSGGKKAVETGISDEAIRNEIFERARRQKAPRRRNSQRVPVPSN